MFSLWVNVLAGDLPFVGLGTMLKPVITLGLLLLLAGFSGRVCCLPLWMCTAADHSCCNRAGGAQICAPPAMEFERAEHAKVSVPLAILPDAAFEAVPVARPLVLFDSHPISSYAGSPPAVLRA